MLNQTPEFDHYYVAYLKDDPAKEPIAASYSAPAVLAEAAQKTGRAKADFELLQIAREGYNRIKSLLLWRMDDADLINLKDAEDRKGDEQVLFRVYEKWLLLTMGKGSRKKPKFGFNPKLDASAVRERFPAYDRDGFRKAFYPTCEKAARQYAAATAHGGHLPEIWQQLFPKQTAAKGQ